MPPDEPATDLRDELVHGLEGPAREARLALVDHLLLQGCTENELRAAAAEDRLALLPLERVLSADGDQTLAQVAASWQVAVDDLIDTRRALGLPVDREGAVYGERLAQHASRLRAAQQAGVPVASLVAINRVIGRAMASIAASGRDVVGATLGDAPDADEYTQATRVAAAIETLIPLMKDVLIYAYEEHALEVVRNEQAGALGFAAGVADVREIAVAFADLVGFTELGDGVAPAELGSVAGRLETLAGDALRPRVTLVKTIGDEVMLVSPDATALAESVLALVAAADAEGDDFPRLRAGAAAGSAVRRSGDWYGAPVNLASRLTAVADPGALVADEAFRRAAGEAAGWTKLGERPVRGVREPVAVYAATAR